MLKGPIGPQGGCFQRPTLPSSLEPINVSAKITRLGRLVSVDTTRHRHDDDADTDADTYANVDVDDASDKVRLEAVTSSEKKNVLGLLLLCCEK